MKLLETLISIANDLDSRCLFEEANTLDGIISKASSWGDEQSKDISNMLGSLKSSIEDLSDDEDALLLEVTESLIAAGHSPEDAAKEAGQVLQKLNEDFGLSGYLEDSTDWDSQRAEKGDEALSFLPKQLGIGSVES